MTTIAFDRFSIAADTLAINDGIVEQGPFQKLFLKDGRVYAIAGLAALLPRCVEWYEGGCDPEKIFKVPNKPNWFVELIVYEDGKFIQYSPLPEYPYGSEVTVPFAIGSGAKFAMGAMLAGKTPAEAVAIAAKLDDATGGPIQEIDLRTFAQPRYRIDFDGETYGKR